MDNFEKACKRFVRIATQGDLEFTGQCLMNAEKWRRMPLHKPEDMAMRMDVLRRYVKCKAWIAKKRSIYHYIRIVEHAYTEEYLCISKNGNAEYRKGLKDKLDADLGEFYKQSVIALKQDHKDARRVYVESRYIQRAIRVAPKTKTRKGVL